MTPYNSARLLPCDCNAPLGDMSSTITVLLAVTSLLVSSPCIGRNLQRTRLLPVDEAKQVSGFAAFRRRLIRATRERDWTHLRTVTSENITVDFGGGVGRSYFREYWKPESRASKLWPTLYTVLSLGGRFDRNRTQFCAPYVYTDFPSNLDGYKWYCVICRGVPLRAQPSYSSRAVAILSYDLVRPIGNGRFESAWVRIVTARGRRGFIRRSCLRSPVDYRACFEKTKQGWRLSDLVNGD